MSEHPTTPPLNAPALRVALSEALSEFMTAAHPDLPRLDWALCADGSLYGHHVVGGYGKAGEELAEIAAAWAHRLGLEQGEAYFAGRVSYRGCVDDVGEIEIEITVDAAALKADLDARKAAREAGRQIAAEAGGSVMLRSEPCERLLAEWRTHPQDSVQYRLAEFAVSHTDDEIRAELITYLDEDPADSAPVVCARALWPTLTSAVTA